jgi:acetyl-CoA/propionyl-CoA carboxylase biotin carboxyl carrier protein
MIAKLIVHDVDRERARHRMLRALSEFEIGGVPTLLGFHRALLTEPCFIAGETCDGIVESERLAACASELEPRSPEAAAAPPAAAVLRERTTLVEVDGRRLEVKLLRPEPPWAELARRRRLRVDEGIEGGGLGKVTSPMQGTVLAVRVAEGDHVHPGQVLCIVEAMKMENEIHALSSGVVTGLSVSAGDAVRTGQVICVVE